ncbi:MAG: hypothetical protein ACO3A2_10235 [Bdellovibrionia bacterium]
MNAQVSLGIRQFRDQGQLSYLIFDRITRKAAIVQPGLSLIGEYQAALLGERLELSGWIDSSAIGSSQPQSSEAFRSLWPHAQSMNMGFLGQMQLGSHSFSSFGEASDPALLLGPLLFVSSLAQFRARLCDPRAQSGLQALPPFLLLYPLNEDPQLAFSLLEKERLGQVNLDPRCHVLEIGLEKYKKNNVPSSNNSMGGLNDSVLHLELTEVGPSDAILSSGVNAVSLPEVGLWWPKFQQYQKIFISSHSGSASARVAQTLTRLGLDRVIQVSSGRSAWRRS